MLLAQRRRSLDQLTIGNKPARNKEFDAIRVYHAERIVTLATLLSVLVLSGCSSTSGLEVAKDVGMSVLIEAAAVAVTDCKDFPQPRNSSTCEDQTDAVVKLGQSLRSELKPSDDSPSAEELSNELDTFIEQRRTPAAGNRDDTEEVASP